ncbi:hypothetical protein BYT27DRAFT_7098722 [Phlegmacium glaucopus]|nr:hypothetical protein BYT27DRAFT_7098722 [Phlegmacium glaucopus]
MAQKPNDELTKSTPQDTQTSIFVFISAHAISSLGFAVSLLAIWFGWLLPTSLAPSAPSEKSEIKSPRPVIPRHHRRSVSSLTRTPPVPTPVRRASAPIDLASILVPHHEENIPDSSKRVYFADPPSFPVSRRNTMPEPKKPNNFLGVSILAIPRSSSPSRPETPPNAALDELNAQESDSSLSKPSRLQKLKLGFNLKTNRHLPVTVDKQSDRDSIVSIDSTASEKSTKRTSGGFVATWSNSRAPTAGDVTESGLASSSRLSFARILSPSTPVTATLTPSQQTVDGLPSHKSDRRRSSPIPRTYPYGAPYFASPPVLLDKNNYPSYLKTLPQFEDEIQFSSARASERGREPAITRVVLNSKVVHKRRSASEDWTVRPPTNS